MKTPDWEMEMLREQMRHLQDQMYDMNKQIRSNPYMTATQQAMQQNQLQNQIQQDMASLKSKAAQYNHGTTYGPAFKPLDPYDWRLDPMDSKAKSSPLPAPKSCKPIASFERMLKLGK